MILKEPRNFFFGRFQVFRLGYGHFGGSIVVRQFVYCERFRGFKVDLLHCTIGICLISIIQTGRCGRTFFLNLFVAELECKYRVCAWSFAVVRHYIIVNVSGVLK